VDLSTTVLHDELSRAAGAIGLSGRRFDFLTWTPTPSALPRRGGDEPSVAPARKLQRRSGTSVRSDGGRLAVVGTWAGDGNQQIEASRGLSEEALELIHALFHSRVEQCPGPADPDR